MEMELYLLFLKFTGSKVNIQNGGLHYLIRSQSFDLQIAIIYFTSNCLFVLPLCLGRRVRSLFCSVALSALSSLAIVLLRTIEMVALYFNCAVAVCELCPDIIGHFFLQNS